MPCARSRITPSPFTGRERTLAPMQTMAGRSFCGRRIRTRPSRAMSTTSMMVLALTRHTLQAFEAGSDFYYLKGNATDAYHSKGFNAPSDGKQAKISHFTRELAFFPDQPYPMLVVFDRVVSLNVNWPKKWLLHAIDEPLVNGTVTGVEVPDKMVRYAGDLVTISYNEGRLFSQTLLPASATIRKVGDSCRSVLTCPTFRITLSFRGAVHPPNDGFKGHELCHVFDARHDIGDLVVASEHRKPPFWDVRNRV